MFKEACVAASLALTVVPITAKGGGALVAIAERTDTGRDMGQLALRTREAIACVQKVGKRSENGWEMDIPGTGYTASTPGDGRTMTLRHERMPAWFMADIGATGLPNMIAVQQGNEIIALPRQYWSRAMTPEQIKANESVYIERTRRAAEACYEGN